MLWKWPTSVGHFCFSSFTDVALASEDTDNQVTTLMILEWSNSVRKWIKIFLAQAFETVAYTANNYNADNLTI